MMEMKMRLQQQQVVAEAVPMQTNWQFSRLSSFAASEHRSPLRRTTREIDLVQQHNTTQRNDHQTNEKKNEHDKNVTVNASMISPQPTFSFFCHHNLFRYELNVENKTQNHSFIRLLYFIASLEVQVSFLGRRVIVFDDDRLNRQR